MQNTYEATIKLGSSGLQQVTVQASSLSYARQLLELQYGRDRIMNLHQRG